MKINYMLTLTHFITSYSLMPSVSRVNTDILGECPFHKEKTKRIIQFLLNKNASSFLTLLRVLLQP